MPYRFHRYPRAHRIP